MGLFDRFKRRPPEPLTFHVFRDGDDVVCESSRGKTSRAPLARARSVRIVPLLAGNPHAATGGYQVALTYAGGDMPLGEAAQDWRIAYDLARQVCVAADLELDDMTARMFTSSPSQQ